MRRMNNPEPLRAIYDNEVVVFAKLILRKQSYDLVRAGILLAGIIKKAQLYQIDESE